MYDIDVVQELLDERTEERDTLKKEINKWIHTASKFERERDGYKVALTKLVGDIAEALRRLL